MVLKEGEEEVAAAAAQQLDRTTDDYEESVGDERTEVESDENDWERNYIRRLYNRHR